MGSCEVGQCLFTMSTALVTDTDWEVLVAGFRDDAELENPPLETEQEEQPASPCKLTVLQISSLPTVEGIREDALTQALELYEDTNNPTRMVGSCEKAADEAVWTEAALLYDAVEDVSLLSPDWQAALAHAATTHHHWTSKWNADPLQLHSESHPQTTCLARIRDSTEQGFWVENSSTH